MDLALELGMTATELSARMTERELRQWQRYAMQKLLPARRAEVYLAQVAMTISRAMGGNTQATLADYMINLQPAVEEVEELDDEELAELKIDLGFAPTVWRH